jgi:acyl-CoA synthetase (AMP-forming)/AMP-acid ligase II
MTTPTRRFEYGNLSYRPTLPEMWRTVVAAHRGRDLIVSARVDGTVERLTYGEADARSRELARSLLDLGVVKGIRVGILAPNGPDFAVAFLAATRLGAVAVPINTFFQPPELTWVLRHADIHTLLTVPSLLGKDTLERLEAAVPGLASSGPGPLLLSSVPSLRHVVALAESDRAWLSRPRDRSHADLVAACESAVRPADDLVVIYTSGSRAEPKGVIHVHGPAIRHSHFVASGHDWTPDERVYVPMAFFWVGGLVFGFLGPMQLGVTILTEHRFDPGVVLGLLERERATYATGFPHVGPALANHPAFPSTDLSSLREGYQQILLPPDRRAADPTLRVAQLGMTETCSSHTWWPPHEALPEEKRGSLGVSAPGFEHKIVNERGETVTPGVVGEICVRGHALMRGMVGFTREEVFDSEGWYHTSDAARCDTDGHLHFAGRTDDMIKTSGANVAPIEVENVLLSMPEVREAYVMGLPDPERGAIVTAVVVLNQGAAVDAEQLTQWSRDRLSAYKVPKRWAVLSTTEGLPYTTTNKIDRRTLAERVRRGDLVAR